MNKIADRRKLHNAIASSGGQDDSPLIRMTTTVSVFNNAPPSVDDLKKLIKQLQSCLKNERQLRISAQQGLKMHQLRSMAREKQFYRILEESDQKVRSFVKAHEASSGTAREIKKSYQELLSKFEDTNIATNTLIEQKYKQNLNAMERRIDKIMAVMQQEVAKTKLMSSKNVDQIRKQIQQAISIVKNIENQNLELRLSINQQKHKNKLLEEQRKLLLEQIVNKKFTIAKLYEENQKIKQGKCSQQKLRDRKESKSLSKQSQINEMEQIWNTKKMKTLSTFNQLETKQTTPDKSQLLRTNQKQTKIFVQQQPHTHSQLSKSRFSLSSDQSKKRPMNYLKSDSRNLISSIKKNNQHEAQINYKKMQKKYMKKSGPSNGLILLDEAQHSGHLVTLFKNQTINTEGCWQNSRNLSSNENAIGHLRNCLQREHKKTIELGRLVTTLKNRNEQVNQAILEVLNQTRFKCSSQTSSQANLIQCQKLLKVIVDMKKRLAMCEKPSVQCGWGEDELQNLLEQAQELVPQVDKPSHQKLQRSVQER